MIFRENDERYLSMNASADEGDGMDNDDDEVTDDDASDANADVDMEPGTGHEHEIRRTCDGILRIVLVDEVPFSRFFTLLFSPASLLDGRSARPGLAPLRVGLWDRQARGTASALPLSPPPTVAYPPSLPRPHPLIAIHLRCNPVSRGGR